MFIKAATGAIVLAALSTSATAQQFAGGELTIDAYGYDAADADVSVDYSVALEYAINQNVGIAVDLAYYDFSIVNESIINLTVHSIYHLNDQASVGFIIGNEFRDDASVTFYGLEGGFESNNFSGEGYFALYDNSDNTSVIGLSGAYEINSAVSAIADFGYGSIDSDDITRISAGAEYDFANGPTVYAEFGNLDLDGASSAFIGLGASVQFGADRGTTFDRRGAFETLVPGF
ncbi:porin family protein [Octadecabacter sp.]|nr:porin family protein [Octadecabacter sp.]